MSTAPTQASALSLFDSLAGFIGGNSGAIQNFLTGCGAPASVAAIVPQALAAANGEPVHTNESVSLSEIVAFLLPSVTLPASWPVVTFTDLWFQADKDAGMSFGGSVSFGGQVSAAVGGETLPYNLTDFAIASTVVDNVRQTSGSLTGTLQFASTTFTGAYGLTAGSQTIQADWTASQGAVLPIAAIAAFFNLRGLPSEATDSVQRDLQLTSAHFELDVTAGAGDRFIIDAACAHGDAFVLVDFVDSVVLAAGCEFSNITIGALPQLGIPLALRLPAAAMILATGEIKGFQVPNPSPGNDWPFDSRPIDLQPGVTIAALLDLSQEISGVGAHLNAINGSSTDYLLLEARLPSLSLVVDLGAKTLVKSAITLDLTLTISPTSVMLAGSFVFSGGRLAGLQMSLSLVVTDTEVTGDLNFEYPSGFNPPLPFVNGLWIYDLGGQLGIDFANQELTAGIMGRFLISATQPALSVSGPVSSAAGLKQVMPDVDGDRESASAPPFDDDGTDEFALIVGVNDDAGVFPIPDINLLLLRLNTISFPDLLTAILGKDAPSVNSPLLTGFKASGIELCWCDTAPGAIVLPDGTKPAAGAFKFQGGFDLWGFHVWSAMDVALDAGKATGCSGFFYMQPFHIGQALTVAVDGTNSPPNEVSRQMQAAKFPAGGPWLSFDTAGPDLSADWKVTLFGWTDTVHILGDADKGLTFNMQNQDGSIFTSAIECSFSDSGTLAVHCSGYLGGTLQLPVVVAVALGDVAVGKGDDVTINAQFTADLTVEASSDGVKITAGCSFSFADDTQVWRLQPTPIDANLSSLSGLPAELLKAISADAERIFEDAVTAAGSLIVKYLDKTWNQIEDEAENLYHDVVHTVGVLFGRHQSKRPSIPWLKDGSLLAVRGAQITSDTNDPNYSPDAVYVVQGLRRYHVPDTTTVNWLQSELKATEYSQADNQAGFSPDFVITIPLPDPPAEFPSVQDGTLYYKLGASPPQLYLNISGGDSKPEHYEIQQDAAQYLANISRWGNNPPIQKLPCRPDDIRKIDGSPLDASCRIQAPDGSEAVFEDGVRINNWSPPEKLKTYPLSQNAFNGIPQEPSPG